MALELDWRIMIIGGGLVMFDSTKNGGFYVSTQTHLYLATPNDNERSFFPNFA